MLLTGPEVLLEMKTLVEEEDDDEVVTVEVLIMEEEACVLPCSAPDTSRKSSTFWNDGRSPYIEEIASKQAPSTAASMSKSARHRSEVKQ